MTKERIISTQWSPEEIADEIRIVFFDLIEPDETNTYPGLDVEPGKEAIEELVREGLSLGKLKSLQEDLTEIIEPEFWKRMTDICTENSKQRPPSTLCPDMPF